MGVGKGFWDQLRPLAQAEDLSFLRGKKVAIDLSYWLVQQQTALKDQKVRKPHLRLTFYRVIRLVAKVGALPVFVVDGEAPALKHGARMKRFKRYADASPSLLLQSPTSQENNTSRTGIFFENVEECVILLDLLGMPVLRAKGEAESLCAALNREGLVDACVSPDSDALVHGAKCVIKTMQLDDRNKGPEVELYRAIDIKTSMGLGRNHLVALALLVGCDYSPEGVPGLGCTSALRLISCFPESQILDRLTGSGSRLRAWGRGELPLMDEVDHGVDVGTGVKTIDNSTGNRNKVTHCSRCGHPGKKKEHASSGCQPCISLSKDDLSGKPDCREKPKGFRCSCSSCLQKAQKKTREKSNEWWAKICHRMSSTPGFPDEEIISLFVTSEIETAEDITTYNSFLTWRAPDLEQLETFLDRHLYWDAFYVRQKVLPLLSHFYLTELAAMVYDPPSCSPSEKLLHGAYAPLCIHRIKIEQREPLYRLMWKSMKEGVDGQHWLGLKLKPTSPSVNKRQRIGEADSTDLDGVEFTETDGKANVWCFTTDENIELVKAACPDLVTKFDREQEAKRGARAKVTKEKNVNGSSKRQSAITSYFKQQKQTRLSDLCGVEKSSVEELSPHTPGSSAVGRRPVDKESLITSLNSKSTSTIFSRESPAPVPGTPRRKVSKTVARRLSLEHSL